VAVGAEEADEDEDEDEDEAEAPAALPLWRLLPALASL
jgi:hypothetical protein